MNIDRRSKLLQRSNALAAAGNQGLPQQVRDKYQKAADSLGLSVGLENALQTKAENEAMSSMPSQPQASSPATSQNHPPQNPLGAPQDPSQVLAPPSSPVA